MGEGDGERGWGGFNERDRGRGRGGRKGGTFQHVRGN